MAPRPLVPLVIARRLALPSTARASRRASRHHDANRFGPPRGVGRRYQQPATRSSATVARSQVRPPPPETGGGGGTGGFSDGNNRQPTQRS